MSEDRTKSGARNQDMELWRSLRGENLKNWRAWGSWFSWGSPVGLGLFFVELAVAGWIITQWF